MTEKRRSLRRVAGMALCCFALQMQAGFAADLSLRQAVELALSKNPKIKIAEKGEERTKAQLDGAKGLQRPTLTASSSLGVSDVNDMGVSRNNSNRLQLSLPLYTGGKNEMKISKAKDAVTVSELNLGRTKEDLILNTVTAYYNILQTEKVAKVDEETVRNYQAHLANVQDLYAAGSTPKMDLLRSEVELVNAQQALLKSQNSYEVAVSTLKSIIKMDNSEPLRLSDDAQYIAFAPVMEDCIAYARANRKDLEQARIAVTQAQKDVEIAKGDKRPSVSLSVGNGWDKQLLPDNDNHSLSASVSANWNLFDGNVTESNIKAAKIAVEEAALALEEETDAVDLAVRESYLNMKEAEKRFHTTEVAIQKAQEDYYIANEKYRAGEGIMLDVIDAQLALSTAKTNYIRAQYDYATYKAKLENVMGWNGVKNA